MKKLVGFLILLIVLIAVSGCTQQAKPTTVTTTTAAVAPTTEATPEETTIVSTPEVTTEVTLEVTGTPEQTASPETTAVAANTSDTAVVTQATTLVTAMMTPSTKVTTVHIANNTFTPSVLMVLPGTSITWVNDDSTVHSVKMVEGHKFNSGDIAKSSRWSYSFGATEGTFEYMDGYNTNVTGVIIVKKGESFAGMGTPTTYVTSSATW